MTPATLLISLRGGHSDKRHVDGVIIMWGYPGAGELNIGGIVKQIIRGEKEIKVERVNLEQEMKQHVKLH